MHVQPYLDFNGRCDEALEFYKKAIGAKVGMLMRFKDAPDKSMITPGSENKVMHSQFQVGDTIVNALRAFIRACAAQLTPEAMERSRVAIGPYLT